MTPYAVSTAVAGVFIFGIAVLTYLKGLSWSVICRTRWRWRRSVGPRSKARGTTFTVIFPAPRW